MYYVEKLNCTFYFIKMLLKDILVDALLAKKCSQKLIVAASLHNTTLVCITIY